MPTGAKIKEIRKQKGLTQKQLGDLCGMADSAIRRYENGNANPKIETLQKIADALGVSLRELLLSDEITEVDGMPAQTIDLMGYSMEDIGKALRQMQIELHPKSNQISNETLEDQDMFLSFLEWLGYRISVVEHEDMQSSHFSPLCDDDYVIGIQDNKRDFVTFFHKKEFLDFQKEIMKAIDYEIYKQFHKDDIK